MQNYNHWNELWQIILFLKGKGYNFKFPLKFYIKASLDKDDLDMNYWGICHTPDWFYSEGSYCIKLNYFAQEITTKRINKLPILRKNIDLPTGFVKKRKKDRWGEYYSISYEWETDIRKRFVSIAFHEIGHYLTKTKQHNIPDNEIWTDFFEMYMTCEYLNLDNPFKRIYKTIKLKN